jgi:hypothetical protein
VNQLPLTPNNWSEGLHQACRHLRMNWPAHWEGLPRILTLCQQSLRLEQTTDDDTIVLNQFAQWVAHDIEQQFAGNTRPTEPAYHNRLHTADVLIVLTTMLHILHATHAAHEDNTWSSALLAAAVAHDYKHPGGVNQFAFQIERASWQGVQHIAQTLPSIWRQRIESWILGTDAQSVHLNHQRIADQVFAWEAPWAQVLLNEADIYVSATSEFGPGLSDALAREWQCAEFAGHTRVATNAGRADFLHNAHFSSPTAKALGIQAQVEQQLTSLKQQD